MNKAKTAIIVVNYRTAWHLERCLTYLFKYTKDFHVYLVHNKPDSESVLVGEKFAAQHSGSITIFVNEKNLGFTGGVNTAYPQAVEHEYVCLLNSDVLVTAGWLDKQVAVLEADSGIVQVAPDTNQYYPESFIWKALKQTVARVSRPLWHRLYEFRYYLAPPKSGKTGFHEYEYFFQFCGGFCTVFRAAPLRERGHILDPEIIHGYWDDNELSFYLRQFGRIGKVEDAYVFHYLNVSFDQVLSEKQDLKRTLQQLNGYYVFNKWRDFILSELNKLSAEKAIELVRNTYEVDQFMQFFGLEAQHPEFKPYLAKRKVVEIGEKFLN